MIMHEANNILAEIDNGKLITCYSWDEKEMMTDC